MDSAAQALCPGAKSSPVSSALTWPSKPQLSVSKTSSVVSATLVYQAVVRE